MVLEQEPRIFMGSLGFGFILGFIAGITRELISPSEYGEALKMLVPEKTLAPNIRAFDMGYRATPAEMR